MKKFVVVAAVLAGLVAPAGSAAAETVAAPAATTSAASPVGSSSADVFCAVLKFLKGGWAGRPADCSF
ncbi:hypothetical protein ABZV58_04840 [Nocardia sp. NPDC004654]|uniref:hypothetical protein n=1 Tax=Nocardia sp. NPDC004654 TaxID=3154776 RepID=UPI00339F3283